MMTLEEEFGIPPIKKEDIMGLTNSEITDFVLKRLDTYHLQIRALAEYRQRQNNILSAERRNNYYTNPKYIRGLAHE